MRKLLFAALSLFVATSLFGQSTSLSGTVADPTGAVIPGATITIVNTQTGAQREIKSDDQGRYLMPQLAPGTYKLTAKASGFADVVIANVELLVNQPATVPIVFEKVGTTSTTITVESAAVQVNTSDATLGNAIGAQAITNLPFFARNVAGLLAFQPGVTSGGNVNGGKSDQGNITLDGIDVNDQNSRAAMSSVLRVTLDSVQEFRTTTSNANADQGRSSGAQIALVTRSGSNNFSGALYEYRRGSETAANDFFNNAATPGLPRPVLLINVFGGRGGGPIIKNRLFFFLNYEGRRDASASSGVRTVPSDLLRQGILQYRTTAGTVKQIGPAEIQALDPAHIGINPNSSKLFNLYPKSNDTTQGDGLNFVGYRFNSPVRSDQNTYISKFDWNIDNSARHQVFFRGQLQNDSSNGLPQFPGLPPNSVSLNNSKGIAIGYTAVLRPTLVSTFRYGFTRAGREATGVQTTPVSTFRNLSTFFGTGTGTARIVPVNHISEDLAWTKGAHDVRFGAVLRYISNGSIGVAPFHGATTNVSWLFGTGAPLQPSDLNSTFRTAYGDAMTATLGILSQVTSRFNYKVDGSVIPQGDPLPRKYNNEEYEWYVQDTWRVSRALTLTLGLRHSLMPPIYEANGQQTSTNIPLGEWFYKRAALASIGAPQTVAGPITFILPTSEGGRELYRNHLKNFAPRFALAYSPQGNDGLSKFLFGGPGRTSIRAGWGMFYDLFGQPLAQTYAASAFGFSTSLSNPSNILTELTAPRFVDFFTIPTQYLQPAPKGGFPTTYPNVFQITNSIDDGLVPPYTMNTNFSIGREFDHGLFIQGSYVSRLSRRSLINRDLAMPTNIVDTKSGMDYFTAAQTVIRAQRAGVPVAGVAPVPFWENLYPGLARNGLTSTQIAYQRFAATSPDYTGALQQIDQLCTLSCSIYGPYTMFNPQFSALSAWSSVGRGNFHSMQWTVRKRFGTGLTFDFNYTWGKSLDLGSVSEDSGSFSGFILNPWKPQQRWSVSDYDSTHIVNFFAVWDVPVGRGRKFLTNSHRAVDLVLGGWQLAPTWSQSSATPFSVGNGRNWPTNWNITGNATQVGPVSTSITRNAQSVAGAGGPNIFANPTQALAAYTFTLPGESGERNVNRRPGPGSINLAVAKTFHLFTLHDAPHRLIFRWETFNVTNSVIFAGLSADLGNSGTFGKFSSMRNDPRQMQFALRYEF
jgi:hypothetical protein